MTVPPGTLGAAQGYDFAHRFDDDQPRVISWGRVPDYQVARLLAGAAPLIAAAERDRIRGVIQAERDLFADHAAHTRELPSLATNLAIRAGLIGTVLDLIGGSQ